MKRPALDEILELFGAVLAVPEGITTAPGAGAGTSIIDAGLAGSGANSFVSMLMVLYPGQPRLVDSMDITGFINATGEVIFDRAYKGVAAAIPAGVPYKIVTFRFVPAEVAALTALVTALMTEVANTQHETEWAVGSAIQQVASALQTNLTACSVTPTFPTGSTRVRAILVASIHAANQAGNTHHIDFKVEGQRNGLGYVAQLDLTAQDSLGLVNLDGASDGWSGAIDVTALVTTSAVQYDFRFVVDSDNAGAVNYTQNFALVLVYTI